MSSKSSSYALWTELLSSPQAKTLIQLSLEEDIGSGDITTKAMFPSPIPTEALLVARSQTAVCGIPLAQELLRMADPAITTEALAEEGQVVEAGKAILRITGDIRPILIFERPILNYLMRLCGIATQTRTAIQAIPKQCPTQIYDTRKTLPGWRAFDKLAVRIGGGQNHRFGLYDAYLIKDNHVAICGSIKAAVERAKAHREKNSPPIQIEVDTLEQFQEALEAKPDMILLDNFTLSELEKAVHLNDNRFPLEASGGITMDTIPEIAQTGVHRISIGAITHTVKPADLALDIPEGPR